MFPAEARRGKLQLVASREASEGSMFLNQDAKVYLSTLDPGTEIVHPLEEGRHAWVQVMRGTIDLNGSRLDTSDGAAVSAEALLSIRAEEPSELLVFDLS
jgi:redox-sensitive bicupin YhaK (pirin superfamily)